MDVFSRTVFSRIACTCFSTGLKSWPRATPLGLPPETPPSPTTRPPQAATELLAVLSRSRPACEQLLADPLICSRLVGAFFADLFMTSPVAYGLALEYWDVVHRFRPRLLLEHW